MSARAKRDVVTLQAGHFGQAQACLQRRQQERVVAAAAPGALVRRLEEYVDLRARHEIDQLAVEPFSRHGEDTLNLRSMGRHLVGGEAEERSNSRQAKIAGASRDAARAFKIMQKRGDEGRVELFKSQAIRRRAQPLLCESQQQPECIPVRTDRVRADALLLHQPLREEPLQEHRKRGERGFHWEASQ